MWTLFRQWRLVRWVEKELLRHEEEQHIVTYGAAILLAVNWVVPEFRSRWWVRASDVSVRRLFELCVREGYLETQEIEESGLSVKVAPKGTHFVPVLSGLLMGELGVLGNLWAFLAGGGLVLAVWALHSVKAF